MKLKILAVPVLIVLIIIFSIWVIQPTYSSAMESKNAYLQSIEKVNDISEKLDKAKKLSEELAQIGEERKVITDFLPENKEEEYVINYFNDLALREGVSILNFTLNQRASQAIVPVLDQYGNPTTEIDSTPTVKYIDARLSVAGNYEKVKSFLRKFNGLKRFNDISTIKISRGSSDSNSNSGSDSLLVEAVSGFGYLEKMKTVTNISNKAITSAKFDLSVVDRIKNYKNTESAALILDSAGKENPFLR